ncbi:DUF4405 domain-containing protein [Lutibacter sp. A64]|uniref:DUF4405 domain-containing protein n=1 Tax=Lutibacter sp. A64 TaxID=2918526 RepID=UPI001F065643|nr:DUF4405 domain-containing protein [Lutibacter sp. A64]UMB55076.1 DUF4405 domain-containing protein [Lutibacter sp. A64]
MKIKKPTVNFIINALMFFCLSAVASTGLLIKYRLASGQEQMVKYGNKVHLSLFGMDRHDWGEIHLIIGYILIGLLLLHIILHWKIIVSVYKKLSQKKPTTKLIIFSFITICFLIIIIPFIANVDTTRLNNNTKTERLHLHQKRNN